MTFTLLFALSIGASTSTAAATSTSTEDRVSELEGKLSDYEETIPALQAIAEKLNKIKLSGYIQGRFECHEDSQERGLNAAGRPGTTTQFLVRPRPIEDHVLRRLRRIHAPDRRDRPRRFAPTRRRR